MGRGVTRYARVVVMDVKGGRPTDLDNSTNRSNLARYLSVSSVDDDTDRRFVSPSSHSTSRGVRVRLRTSARFSSSHVVLRRRGDPARRARESRPDLPDARIVLVFVVVVDARDRPRRRLVASRRLEPPRRRHRARVRRSTRRRRVRLRLRRSASPRVPRHPRGGGVRARGAPRRRGVPRRRVRGARGGEPARSSPRSRPVQVRPAPVSRRRGGDRARRPRGSYPVPRQGERPRVPRRPPRHGARSDGHRRLRQRLPKSLGHPRARHPQHPPEPPPAVPRRRPGAARVGARRRRHGRLRRLHRPRDGRGPGPAPRRAPAGRRRETRPAPRRALPHRRERALGRSARCLVGKVSATVGATPQSELGEVSHAPKVSVDESVLDFVGSDARTLHNKVRGFAGWPGTKATFEVRKEGEETWSEVTLKIVGTRVGADSDERDVRERSPAGALRARRVARGDGTATPREKGDARGGLRQRHARV